MHNVKIIGDTPLVYLTVDQFLELQRSVKTQGAVETLSPKKRYAYGYTSIANELLGGASKATVFRLLKSGRISPAITRSGKIIICDLDLAMELLRKPQGGRK